MQGNRVKNGVSAAEVLSRELHPQHPGLPLLSDSSSAASVEVKCVMRIVCGRDSALWVGPADCWGHNLIHHANGSCASIHMSLEFSVGLGRDSHRRWCSQA